MTSPYVFPANSSFQFIWNLVDQTGTPVEDATVLATLYYGRDLGNPTLYPGTAVTNFSAVTLVNQNNGQYIGVISAMTGTQPGAGYVVVVDSTRPDTTVGHWEELAVVAPGDCASNTSAACTC
jgi:hypothetical protein